MPRLREYFLKRTDNIKGTVKQAKKAISESSQVSVSMRGWVQSHWYENNDCNFNKNGFYS